MSKQDDLALALSGGGSRGAYQAGVVRALSDIQRSVNQSFHPKILSGISAGAINAAFLASQSHDWKRGAQRLSALWTRLRFNSVFRTDPFSLGQVGIKWIRDATIGAFYSRKYAQSLLETQPLREYLRRGLPYHLIQDNIDNGNVNALSVTSFCYTNTVSSTFFMGQPGIKEWQAGPRIGFRSEILIEHLMASSAIPILFPPVQIGKKFFGDGCLRNDSPLSPAINLGANKIIVIGVSQSQLEKKLDTDQFEPSVARIFGMILNDLMLDAVDTDISRLERINEAISQQEPNATRFRHIDVLWMRPRQSIARVAERHFSSLPKTIRYLLNGLGSRHEASEIASYILFCSGFLRELIEIGYQDTMERREEVIEFLRT